MFGKLFKAAEELAKEGKTETEIRQALFRIKGAKVAGIASVMRVVDEMKLVKKA